MKAKDLRIGNLVNITDEMQQELWDCAEICTENKPLEISMIENTEARLFIENDDFEFNYEDLIPIELTEEWLIKFEKISWLSKDNDGFFYWFNGEKKYIKFVHVLQNTYFCIELKELKYETNR